VENRQRDGLGALAGCQLVGISCMFSAASVHRLDRILEISGFQGGLWKPVTSNSRKLAYKIMFALGEISGISPMFLIIVFFCSSLFICP